MQKGKWKKHFIFPLCLVLTGCNVNYTVTFSNNEWKENMYIYTTNTEFIEKTNTEEKASDIADTMYQFEKKFSNFKRTFEYDDFYTGYVYETTFPRKKNTSWDTIAKQCYKKIEIKEEKNHITIQTSDEFLCYDKFDELENVTITYKTTEEVIDHNADHVSQNKYTWNITEEEASYKPIYIKAGKDKIQSTKKKESLIPIVTIVTLVILAIIVFIAIQKRNKNNDF